MSRFGPLPEVKDVMAVFTATARSGADAADAFPDEILRALAGLTDARRRMAMDRPGAEDIASGAMRLSPSAAQTDSDPWFLASRDAQRHMATIDFAARRVLGPPRAGALEHHEGLGTVFGRMAYWYVISFDRFVLDGPEGRNRRALGLSFASYETLARELASGRSYLPEPSAHPQSRQPR